MGAACLENSDETPPPLQRALEARPRPRLRTHAQRAQMLRQLVGASLKLRIAERLLLEHNRNRIRRLRRLRRKQLRNRPRLKRPRRRVPILQDPAPLLPRDKLKPPNRNLGIGSSDQQLQKSLLIVGQIDRAITSRVGIEVDPKRSII